MRRLTEAEIQKVIADAEQQIDRKIFFEPRVHYDAIYVGTNGGVTSQPASHPDSFKNGEQFPHHMTHVAFSFFELASPSTDERMLQRYGARAKWHDNLYPNRNGAALPVWQTQPNSLQPALTQGTSVWQFQHPVVLSARDSLKVTVALTRVPEDDVVVAVGFHGVGILSRRPYFLQAEITLDATGLPGHPHDLDAVAFRNDGSEPIALYDQVVLVTSSGIPGGDTRLATVQVKQTGNGTSASWYVPRVPQNDGTAVVGGQLPPASLLGVTGGRAIIHRIPGDGWVWLPGDGIDWTAQDLGFTGATATGGVLLIATLGYVVVK